MCGENIPVNAHAGCHRLQNVCCNISHVCYMSALVKAGIEACANQTFVIVVIFASLLLCLCVWLVMDSTIKQSIITTALCKYNIMYICIPNSIYTIYRFNNTGIYTWYVIFASLVYHEAFIAQQ